MPSKDKAKNADCGDSDEVSRRIGNDALAVAELKALYAQKLLPIEKTYLFSKFHYPEILEAEMGAKPTVLLVGQYSTGKTSFIRNLIDQDYPEMHIGPEPTTDRFIAVVHGEESKSIKGNALTGINDLPFAGLSTFGTGFLNKFSASVTPAPLLKQINIIDTPGVLSGEKQRTSRGYDFAKVCRWFAERSDLILLMFDPSKLDISDEFKSVIEELQPHEEKVHCVLNKADGLDTESLMRVYGALLWSMGKVFRGAEVTRVYVGSFSEKPITRVEHTALFNKDKDVLMSRLAELHKDCGMRKVNDIVKRIRLATVNACVLGHLKSQMPYLWGAAAAQERLIKNLPAVFEAVRREYSVAEGDFPKLEEFRAVLRREDFYKFPSTKKDTLVSLHDMLTVDIPRIMSCVHGVTTDAPGMLAKESPSTTGDKATSAAPAPRALTKKEREAVALERAIAEDERRRAVVLKFATVICFLLLLACFVIISFGEDHKTLKRYAAQFAGVDLPDAVPVTGTAAMGRAAPVPIVVGDDPAPPSAQEL